MKKCRVCGLMICKSAAICPGCGASNPGLGQGELVAGSLLLIVIICGLLWWAWPAITVLDEATDVCCCCCLCGYPIYLDIEDEIAKQQVAISGTCLPGNVFIMLPGIGIWVEAFKRRW